MRVCVCCVLCVRNEPPGYCSHGMFSDNKTFLEIQSSSLPVQIGPSPYSGASIDCYDCKFVRL